MSYLQDRKQKRSRKKIIIGVVLVVLIFFILSLDAVSLFVSGVSQSVGRFIWKTEREAVVGIETVTSTKSGLLKENMALKEVIEKYKIDLIDQTVLQQENELYKKILGENTVSEFTRVTVVSRPNQSPYDTIVVSFPKDTFISVGKVVYASPEIAIGTVGEVFNTTATIKLFSAPGEKVNVYVSSENIPAEAVGRGGQNFEMIFPRDIEIPLETFVFLPIDGTPLVGVVKKVLFDPRDPFQKVLFSSPVNIQMLSHVFVEK